MRTSNAVALTTLAIVLLGGCASSDPMALIPPECNHAGKGSSTLTDPAAAQPTRPGASQYCYRVAENQRPTTAPR